MMVSLSLYFSWSSMNPGISALHGPHHVAQKFRSTTLFGFLNDASSISLPFTSFNLKFQFASLAFAMHEPPSAWPAAVSWDAAGVTVAAATVGAASSFGFHTNGMLMPRSAIA